MKVDVEGSELEALCSASGLLTKSVAWLGFELNHVTTSVDDALQIKKLLKSAGMAQRSVPGLKEWQWANVGSKTGYMVMYERDAAPDLRLKGCSL